jgi:hypothetical protein
MRRIIHILLLASIAVGLSACLVHEGRGYRGGGGYGGGGHHREEHRGW